MKSVLPAAPSLQTATPYGDPPPEDLRQFRGSFSSTPLHGEVLENGLKSSESSETDNRRAIIDIRRMAEIERERADNLDSIADQMERGST